MATDDRQVLVTGKADAPAHFRIPGNGQLRPKAVTAHYDGSGAGGSFLAALKVTSDAGELVGVYPISTAIAAGASARVSWFPRVGTGGSGGAGLSAISVNFDVGGGSFAAGTHTLPIQSYSTNDSSLFTVPNLAAGLIDINEDCSLLAVGRLSFSPPEDLADNTILNVLGSPATGFSGDIAAVPADATHIIQTSFLDGSTVLAVFAGDFSGLVLELDGAIANVTGAGLALVKLTGSQLF